jgi:hypothetical protein
MERLQGRDVERNEAMRDTIDMAREAGGDDWGLFKDFMPEIERLEALVRADEREACAKVCEELAEKEWADNERCAAAIRARGNT